MAEPEAGQLVLSLKYVMLGFDPYFLLSRSVKRPKGARLSAMLCIAQALANFGYKNLQVVLW